MSNTPVPDNEKSWPEGSTPDITFTLNDRNGDPIPLANIQTLKLTQWVSSGANLPGTKINSRNLQNVLNTNQVTVHATSGLVTWLLTTGDTAMQDRDVSVADETHFFRFDVAYTAGSDTIRQSGPGPESNGGADFYVIGRKQLAK